MNKNNTFKIINYIIITFCVVSLLINILSVAGVKNAKTYASNVKIKQIDVKNNKKDLAFKENIEVSNNISKDNGLDLYFSYDNKLINIENEKTEFLNLKNVDTNKKIQLVNFFIKNGFSKESSINYVFPEIKKTVQNIEKNTTKKPIDSKIEILKNTGNIKIKNCKNGVLVDKNILYNDIFYNLSSKNKKIIKLKFNEIKPEFDINECEIFLKGSYKTSFKNSNNSRKNNIKTALKSLDGVVIMPNEQISFNRTTGERNEKNGYQKAKTIKNGIFVPEFGGGVCQVSTTLYNTCLLANLEIVEVNPHSLPVSYEKPCFDAMVNMGTSDLVVKNNTDKPIIIATSSSNDECLINVYGVKNKFKIVRKSEIIDNFIHFDKIKTQNYELYGFDKPLKEGEEIVVCKGKEGFEAIGVLEYYIDDVLVKTEVIRKDIYKPTKEVVLVGGEQ